MGRAPALTSSKNHFRAAAPHILAKHAILRGYLSAWFAILDRAGRRHLLYLDGFAGPGRFKDESEGSPILALKLANGLRLSADTHFAFIEKNPDFATELQSALGELVLSPRIQWEVRSEEFAEALPALIAEWGEGELATAPIFAFVDPFGIKGLPFDLIRLLLRRPSSEVFVTFMNEGVRRCLEEYPSHVNALLGSPTAAETLQRVEDRVVAARELYREALKGCARHICTFQVRNARNQPLYDLFFATNSNKGLIKMKEAMWRTDRSGYFIFSDARDPAQQSLFSENPGERFAPLLWSAFRGKRATIEEVDAFADQSETYLGVHARAALRAMEKPEGVQDRRVRIARANCRGGRRASLNQFPTGTTIEFLDGGAP